MNSSGRIEATILVSSITMAASNSVVFALMGNLQDTYHLSGLGVGVMVATGFVTSLVVQLLASPLADRGWTRWLLVGGGLVSVLGDVLLAAGSSLVSLVAGRALIGAAGGLFFPAARAVMTSLSDVGRSARLGRQASAELGGFVVGPVIGGALVGPLGLRLPFLLFAVIAVVGVALVATGPLPALQRTGESDRPALGLLRNRHVLVAVLLAATLSLPIGMYEALWDRFLTDLGASDNVVGISIAAYAVPYITMSSLGARFVERWDPIRFVLGSLAVIAPLTALYGTFRSVWPPMILGVLEASAQALAYPALQLAVTSAAPPGRTAAAQGLIGATNMGVAAVVSFLAAWGYGRSGPAVVFVGCALAVSVIGLGVAVLSGAVRVGRPQTVAPR